MAAQAGRQEARLESMQSGRQCQDEKWAGNSASFLLFCFFFALWVENRPLTGNYFIIMFFFCFFNLFQPLSLLLLFLFLLSSMTLWLCCFLKDIANQQQRLIAATANNNNNNNSNRSVPLNGIQVTIWCIDD